MKFFLTIFFLVVRIATAAEPSTGVELENGVSPDKKLEVVLEADKETPRYKEYDFKEGDLICELVLSPLHPKDGGDPIRHKITLRLGPGGLEVVAREKLKE